MASAAAAPVQVLEQRRVAGLDATVLAATDAAALNQWLGAHRYPSRPGLTQWLARYVAQGYFVTAFRYAAEPAAPSRAARCASPSRPSARSTHTPSRATRRAPRTARSA